MPMTKRQKFIPILGDLSKLTQEQQRDYVLAACDFLGIPADLDLVNLTWMDSGDGARKLLLYIRKGATDIIRDHRKINVDKLEVANGDGYVGWIATGRDSTGRQEIAVGAISIKGLTGRAVADAVKTAQTQALRRMTLQFAGGGFLDESEIHEKTTNILNSVEGLELLPTAVKQENKIETTIFDPKTIPLVKSEIEVSKIPLVEPQLDPIAGEVTVDTTGPVTAAQPEKRKRRPRKIVNLDPPNTTASEISVVEEKREFARVPGAFNEAENAAHSVARAAEVMPSNNIQLPTKEQEEGFRDRLSKYVNEILPPGGFVQTERLGTRNAQMKSFVKSLFPGANLKSLSLQQWNYLLTFLDEGATNVDALVKEIYARIGA